MDIAQTPQESFRLILLTVMGQALAAAGYTLEERPAQWAGGMFRFKRQMAGGLTAFIEFQLLAYVATDFAEHKPSRFRVTLTRSDPPTPTAESRSGVYARRTLSALVVEDFGVAILPDADYWWTFTDMTTLGKTLAEAGHLLIGFGVPWLAGDLNPKEEDVS
jgi:hypothetical protein